MSDTTPPPLTSELPALPQPAASGDTAAAPMPAPKPILAEVLAEAKPASPALGVKRPRVTEPVTHFLSASSLSSSSQAATDPVPSPAAPPPATPPSGGEPVPPKQARFEGGTSTTPRSPYANVPRKVPRKTPVSTPTSSLGTPPLVSPSLVAPPTASGAAARQTPASLAAAAAKKATLHQRWAGLMHSVLMKERQPQESERVLEVCRRVVEAIPGDLERTKDTFQTLLFGIKDAKNGELRRQVVEGELPVERFVTMDDRELANPELRKQIEERMEERSKDTNLSEIKKAMRTSNSTLFKCHVCGARDSSWEQRQTRSGDEPMTVIITCNKCNTQWRKY